MRIRITPVASLLYSQAARRLAARAVALDDLESWKVCDALAQRERESELVEISLAAIVASYSSIEAVVNELYLERAEFVQGAWFPGLSDQLATGFTLAWFEGAGEPKPPEKQNPIEKARLALSIAGVQTFDWGSGAAQSLGFLQDLRNALLHHKPFTVDRSADASAFQDPLERTLTKQFKTAVIWRERNVNFRWAGCLGGDCARWAANSALNFQRDFFGALGCGYPAAGLEPLERGQPA